MTRAYIHTYISTDFPNLQIGRETAFLCIGESVFQATVPSEPAGNDQGFQADFASPIFTSFDLLAGRSIFP